MKKIVVMFLICLCFTSTVEGKQQSPSHIMSPADININLLVRFTHTTNPVSITGSLEKSLLVIKKTDNIT